MTDLSQDPPTATAPPGPIPETTPLTAQWGLYLTTVMVAVASPISSTVAFFWQMYAPGLLSAAVPPSEVHDLFMGLFSKLETIARGGALTVSVHSGAIASALKYFIDKFPDFEAWLLSDAVDPWIKEELQAYGIIPKG